MSFFHTTITEPCPAISLSCFPLILRFSIVVVKLMSLFILPKQRGIGSGTVKQLFVLLYHSLLDSVCKYRVLSVKTLLHSSMETHQR